MGISMSDILYRKYKIANKVRLIELFAGVGTQAMALRDLGVDFTGRIFGQRIYGT